MGQCVSPASSLTAAPPTKASQTHCPTTAGRRRKQEGAVYTPAFITRYLVEQALGGVLKQRFETLRRQHEAEAAGTARKALVNPNAYDLAALSDPAVHPKAFDWQEVFREVFAQGCVSNVPPTACQAGAG